MSSEAIAHAQAVKARHERELMSKRNVVGVGIGLRQRGGQPTGQVCIIVSVSKKMPASKLAPHDLIPPVLEDVPVDVQETGVFRAR